jgi:hypothetical protein
MVAPLDLAPADLFDVAARLSEDHVSMGKRANVRMARDVARARTASPTPTRSSGT